MKVSRFFMWVIGIINLALVMMLMLGTSPDKTALNAADQISSGTITETSAALKKDLSDAETQLKKLKTDVTEIENSVAAYELSVTGETQLKTSAEGQDGETKTAANTDTNSTLLFDATGEKNEVAEIRSTYIIQQVCAKVDDFMTYSDVSMPFVTRSFTSSTTEAEMIEALVARFTAEADAHGCSYFRLEYKGVQYNKVGTAEYVFCLYFS